MASQHRYPPSKRPGSVTLTPSALNQVRALLGKAPTGTKGLRFGLKKGGCAGSEYTVEYTEEERPGDDIVHVQDVTLYIDAPALLFLLGTEVDYQSSILGAGFVFKNPNEISACGCGESVELKKADTPSLRQVG